MAPFSLTPQVLDRRAAAGTVNALCVNWRGERGLRTGTETVLLVEDEDAVREIVRRVLERPGYYVLEASSGPRALALSATWARGIDLLLTDVIMPEMNGPQLAAQLLVLRPGLRVLYASGYAADALGPNGTWNARSSPDPEAIHSG